MNEFVRLSLFKDICSWKILNALIQVIKRIDLKPTINYFVIN